MKISIIKNNFVNPSSTFSYTRGKGDDGKFYSFKTMGFIFTEHETFDVDLDSLEFDDSSFGKTYTIKNNSNFKRVANTQALDQEIVTVRNKTIKHVKFPNLKDYSPEDGITTAWAFWQDTDKKKYSGMVDPQTFKKNSVFSAEGVVNTDSYGEQMKVTTVEVRSFDLNVPEFLLKNMGFNKNNIDWALSNKFHEDCVNLEISFSELKQILIKAKSKGLLKGLGDKSLKKIISQSKQLRKEMESTSSLSSGAKFKKDLGDIFVEYRVPIFVNQNSVGRDRYLNNIHRGFLDLLDGTEGDSFKRRYSVSGIEDIVDLIKVNPYVLILLPNKGFKTVDDLARQLGVEVGSIERQEACVNGILNGEISGGFSSNGDIYLDRDALFDELVDSLHIKEDGFEEVFEKKSSDLLFQKIREAGNTEFYHWLSIGEDGVLSEKFTNKKNYEEETLIFDSIKQALEVKKSSKKPIFDDDKLRDWIAAFERRESDLMGIKYILSDEQRMAIEEVNSNRQSLFCMTGFAGTGKSTVSKAILALLSIENGDEHGNPSTAGIECLAVSGMASRRINEATGFKSTTITSYSFNPKRIKDTRVLFIDEASMVDSSTLAALFQKINMTTVKVLLVGDVGQLPPIGRGTPFKDILESGWIRSVKLEKIFRQDENAVLTTFAKNMREEKLDPVMLNEAFQDFEFLAVEDSLLYKIRKDLRFYEEIEFPSFDQNQKMKAIKKDLHLALNQCNLNIKNEVSTLIHKYKGEFKKDFTSFQLISPQKSTIIGTESVNFMAQEILNDNEIPFIDGDVKIGTVNHYKRFKVGDKVIHTKNENWFLNDNLGFFKNNKYITDGSYVEVQMTPAYCRKIGGKWGIRILNGMVGIIDSYNQLTNRILVKYQYEDCYIGVEYQQKDLGSLHLGYCLTIHKLQGSEAKTVGLIVSPSHVRMINNNLLYTGITRGKVKGYIVGSKNAFKQGIRKHGTIRQTMLPMMFEGLFWELDEVAKKTMLFQKDEWNHSKSEYNNETGVVVCSTSDNFNKFLGI